MFYSWKSFLVILAIKNCRTSLLNLTFTADLTFFTFPRKPSQTIKNGSCYVAEWALSEWCFSRLVFAYLGPQCMFSRNTNRKNLYQIIFKALLLSLFLGCGQANLLRFPISLNCCKLVTTGSWSMPWPKIDQTVFVFFF